MTEFITFHSEYTIDSLAPSTLLFWILVIYLPVRLSYLLHPLQPVLFFYTRIYLRAPLFIPIYACILHFRNTHTHIRLLFALSPILSLSLTQLLTFYYPFLFLILSLSDDSVKRYAFSL